MQDAGHNAVKRRSTGDAPQGIPNHGLSFGRFRLLPTERSLFEGDRKVGIGGRALDILIILVERAGQIVEKEELLASAWPDARVDEANLRVQISALRRALGDGQGNERFIVSASGRGYSFVAPISPIELTTETPFALPTHNLPIALTRMIGRDVDVNAISALLTEHRLVTIVGSGGIGKTTTAIAVAERLAGNYANSVCFVDLSPIVNADLIASAVAAAMAAPILSENPVPTLAAFLHDQHTLLLLDTCEHLVEQCASFVEALLKGAPRLTILATSREPLRAGDERVYRLPGLPTPSHDANLTAAAAMEFASVRLFAERAAFNAHNFEVGDKEAPVVAEICRRLDGIPLAIEMAAAYVAIFDVESIAQRLEKAFVLLTQGRRTALPRHHTLRAALDWSYALLSEVEHTALQRLSIFPSGFTLQAAIGIAADDEASSADLIARLGELVAKSLVAADLSGAVPRYRLFDTTRTYALEKLEASGERATTTRRYAEYFVRVFQRAFAESQVRPTTDWLADYAPQIDDLRAALDWSFSAEGDVRLGLQLTVASTPLWMSLSLVEECRRYVIRALAAFSKQGGGDLRQEMALNAALGSALVTQRGSDPDTVRTWNRALSIAEEIDDVEYQLRALWGLWADQYYRGDLAHALEIVNRFRSLAERSPDPIDTLVGHRLLAVVLHCLGNQAEARQHAEHVLRHYMRPVHRGHIARYLFDQGVSTRQTLSLVLWLQGYPDQSMRLIRANIDDAREIGHTLSLCGALANTACPISLMTGDLVAAERYISMLLDQTRTHGIAVWHAWGRCFQGVLKIKQGDADSGLAVLRQALEEFPHSGFALRFSAFRTELAETLGRSDVATALDGIEEALQRAEQKNEKWCYSEMLRVKGELLLMRDADTDIAEKLFIASIDLARRQGALSWELRAATSLARLLGRLGRFHEARACLRDVYRKFTEGYDTSDLAAAEALLAELDSELLTDEFHLPKSTE